MAERLLGMRREFDLAFAEPPADLRGERADFLDIAAGQLRCAVALGDVAALLTDRQVVPIPGNAPALLGVTSVRGEVLPVFDLAAMLGAGDRNLDRARWLLVASEGRAAAFAFQALNGHLAAASSAIAPARAASATEPVHAHLSIEGAMLPIVRIGALLERIRTHAPADAAQPAKEP